MGDIFENAVDSLERGVSSHLDTNLPNRQKWAILQLFHAIELFCKERLLREHRLLIYRHIDKPIRDDSLTVGFDEIVGRFTNLGVEIPAQYLTILKDLRKRRNQIEHYKFEPNASHDFVLGEALKFIDWFLKAHLDVSIEVVLPDHLYERTAHLIRTYEEQLRDAEQKIESERSRLDPKEAHLASTGSCPHCGNRTVFHSGKGDSRCHFCDEDVLMGSCGRCDALEPELDLESGLCSSCFDHVMSGD